MNIKSNGKSRMRYCLAAAVLMAGGAVQAAESSTNCLAIYLVDTKIFHNWREGETDGPDGVKTIFPAVLSDADFVSFDTTNDTFVVTATAARRLARSIWELGRQDAAGWGPDPQIFNGGVEEIISAPAPFVLVAKGRRIYSGAFYTEYSSNGFGGPVILADDEFIGTNSTGNESFRIELGYPGTSPGTPDPRGDARIKAAVQELFGQKQN